MDLEGFGAIAGMAHQHPFSQFPCPTCRGLHWRPRQDGFPGDPGILVYEPRGRVVDRSRLVAVLLVP